jgi:hypothetical protein
MKNMSATELDCLRNNHGNPDRVLGDPSTELITALIEGSRNKWPNPEQSARMTAIIDLAHHRGLMLPSYASRTPNHQFGILVLKTPEQTQARDDWLYYKTRASHSTVLDPPFLQQYEESETLLAMFGAVRDYDLITTI